MEDRNTMHIQRIKINLVVVGLVLTGFLVTTISQANPATDGLVGYWPFDEGKGKVATDVSGNKLDGKLAGNPKWVDGKFGKALEFDGKTEHVVVADNDKLDFTKKLTFMAWFNPSAVLTKRRMMVKNNSIFVIFDFGGDGIELLVKPDNTFAESNTTDWKVGQWYHFAGTFDGKTMKVYINGKLDGEAKNSVPIAPSDLELWIGGDDFGRPTDFFPGIIDEVRIYDKTLSATDVQKVMDTPQVVGIRDKLTICWAQIKGH